MTDGKESRDDVFSKSVKAGKRTYFFDVKTTKGQDMYLTITESKKRYSDDGKFVYEKHKLFLYKEDFEKFVEGLNETIARIEEMRANGTIEYSDRENNTVEEEFANTNVDFTDISFDDLGK